MSTDPLDRLTTALAAEQDGAHPTPNMTRQRVLLRLNEERRRRFRVFLLAPLLALGVGSSAWAAAGGNVVALVGWLNPLREGPPSETSGSGKVASQSQRGPSAVRPQPGPLAPEAPPPSLSSPEGVGHGPVKVAEPSMNSTEPARTARALRANSSLKSAPRPEATSTVSPSSTLGPDLALYRQAHDAQFQRADYRAAQSAYRAYLAAYAGQPLAVEARYNLALCDAHLGDLEAARRALQPFADGAFGGYRRDEASALLAVLKTQAP